MALSVNVIRNFLNFLRRWKAKHPLSRFSHLQHEEVFISDYIEKFNLVIGSINYFNARIRRQGIVRLYYSSGLKCYIRSGTSDVLVFEQIFIDEEYQYDFSEPVKIIVDVGANTGLASLYFRNKFPNSKIIALEPNISNFRMLTMNLNQSENLITENVALWNQQKKLNIENPNSSPWAYRMGELDEVESDSHVVSAVDIPYLIEKYLIQRIDVLKIDIEGAEAVVFAERQKWMSYVNYIVIEIHDHIRAGAGNIVFDCLSDQFLMIGKVGENYIFRNSELL